MWVTSTRREADTPRSSPPVSTSAAVAVVVVGVGEGGGREVEVAGSGIVGFSTPHHQIASSVSRDHDTSTSSPSQRSVQHIIFGVSVCNMNRTTCLSITFASPVSITKVLDTPSSPQLCHQSSVLRVMSPERRAIYNNQQPRMCSSEKVSPERSCREDGSVLPYHLKSKFRVGQGMSWTCVSLPTVPSVSGSSRERHAALARCSLR